MRGRSSSTTLLHPASSGGGDILNRGIRGAAAARIPNVFVDYQNFDNPKNKTLYFNATYNYTEVYYPHSSPALPGHPMGQYVGSYMDAADASYLDA
jgi:hypothetical protein